VESVPVVFGAVLIWLLAILSPGPNFLVVSRLALSGSRRAAVAASFGIAVGSVIYAALTLFGLSALILSFSWLGDGLRVLGGVYLVWLGLLAWRSASDQWPPDIEKARGCGNARHGFRTGFLTEITNPKGIAFFLSLFAAAVPAATPLWAKLAILCVGGVMDVVWYAVVAFALSSGPMRARYQRMRGMADRVLGTLLIVVGLKVAFGER
jgi:threonine efflux protein